MAHEVFTKPWIDAWAGELASSDAYREAAATWEGSVLFEMAADGDGAIPEDRAVFVDLHRGECREARTATDQDKKDADFVIHADVAAWRRLLAGELDPVFGLMSGKLKLRRGSLSKLMPYMTAARELVRAAARVDGVFPGEAS